MTSKAFVNLDILRFIFCTYNNHYGYETKNIDKSKVGTDNKALTWIFTSENYDIEKKKTLNIQEPKHPRGERIPW